MTRYEETGEAVPQDPAQRLPCERCGQPPTANGQDPCIADLLNVDYACCGHGGKGYVRFVDGRTLRFENQTGTAIRYVVGTLAERKDEPPLRPGWEWDKGELPEP
jgi:hypothetical protein